MVARRGGDDTLRSARPVLLDRRERSSPFESAELVNILALDEDAPPGGEAGPGGLEGRHRPIVTRAGADPAAWAGPKIA